MASRNDESAEDLEIARQFDSIVARVSHEDVEPSPYLKVRIMAIHDSRQKARALRAGWFWRGLALASSSLALILGLSTYFITAKYYDAVAGTNMALVIDGKGQALGKVAFVRVELPEGVRFSSKRHPELEEQREIILPWSAAAEGKGLSVILKSGEIGMKKVKVEYLDPDQAVVDDREFKIKFRKGEQRI